MVKEGVYMDRISYNDIDFNKLMKLDYDSLESDIYVDKEIFSNEYFMFNPFLKNKTIRIKSQDLLKIYNYLNNKVQIFSLNENNELILELK